MGYGDAAQNTGPIYISHYDPVTRSITRDFLLNTEAIESYKEIYGKLYTPVLDRKGEAISYASGEPWAAPPFSGADSEHTLDIMTYTGTDLWLSTSLAYGRIWRSIDSGKNWSNVYTGGSSCMLRATRFSFLVTYRGKVYTQGYDINNSATICSHSASRVFDGSRWSTGPDLLESTETGGQAVSFADKLVLQTFEYYRPDRKMYLKYFDGVSVKTALPQEIKNYTVGGNYLYVLAIDGKIYRSSDVVNWESFGIPAPQSAASIAVLNGTVYVGTSNSELYAYTSSTNTPQPTPLPTATPVYPTPTSTLPLNSNLIQNSSFETNNNGAPANWTGGVYDTTIARTGNASMRIQGNGGDLYIYQQPPLKPSTTYTIQGYIKTSNVLTTDFGVHIRYGVTGGTTSVNYTQGVSGTTDWTFVSRTFTTPPDYSNGRYDLHVVTSGTAWFDDVAICEGTCSTTTVPTNTPAPTSFPTPTRTPTPISGDTIRPSITITNPTNGAIVQRRGDVTVTASATDNVGVDRVTFSVDGNVSTDFSPPYSYSWSVSGKPNARYTITATAYDAANNSSSQTISVTSSR